MIGGMSPPSPPPNLTSLGEMVAFFGNQGEYLKRMAEYDAAYHKAREAYELVGSAEEIAQLRADAEAARAQAVKVFDDARLDAAKLVKTAHGVALQNDAANASRNAEFDRRVEEFRAAVTAQTAEFDAQDASLKAIDAGLAERARKLDDAEAVATRREREAQTALAAAIALKQSFEGKMAAFAALARG